MGETETGEGVVERAEPVPGPPAEEPVLWSPEVEVCLFHAMLGHKPVGVNRHFHMICIRDKFSQNIGRQISSKVIWEHLRTMYDMQALHESEILPFPNSEKNFILPEEIIQEVKEAFTNTSTTSGKTVDKPSKEKERTLSESGSKESGDKRKRSRLTEKVVNANSNPSSPNANKRRRT
ncbi:MRG/MORF4L-binding protein isoform X2 [Leptodactylus fuscus]|uniref:MRG/MORF4L-binding protein isoform X2 n=1 Tax=Leptodactylus fuscus TaxID=238119 RepID=UPI003F4E6535